jgi:hypothetical protein
MEEHGTGPVRAGLIRRAMTPAKVESNPKMRDLQRGRARIITDDEAAADAAQENAMRESNLAEIARELRRRDLGERQRATLIAERDRILATPKTEPDERFGRIRFAPWR